MIILREIYLVDGEKYTRKYKFDTCHDAKMVAGLEFTRPEIVEVIVLDEENQSGFIAKEVEAAVFHLKKDDKGKCIARKYIKD